MFRFHTRKLPAIFDDMVTRNDDIHSHDTRQKCHLHVPLLKTNLVKMSVCCTGVTRWNYYTKFIDISCYLDVYKKRLKMYLHKHQRKCRVSTIFIHLFLVILLITNGCNTTVYLLYPCLQPVYPIQLIQQQLVYFQCVYDAPFAPVVCTQSCSENTGAYKPVRFPAPFVITTVDCHVLFSLNMFSYLIISVDIYTVPVLLPCVMTKNCLNLFEIGCL